ncbi:hypothetical protein AVEN_26040-1, partial [Araneus ventricosus]
MQEAHVHGVSSVKYGFEPRVIQTRSDMSRKEHRYYFNGDTGTFDKNKHGFIHILNIDGIHIAQGYVDA